MFDQLRSTLKGYKTYLIAAAAVIAALISYADGLASIVVTGAAILQALGFSSLRAAIAKLGA